MIIIYSFADSFYRFLSPIEYRGKWKSKNSGLILGHLSLLCIMIVQWQMKTSWRIGIDYENTTELVSNGFFKISRNSIYLFLLIGLSGLFLAIPNAISFAVLFAAYLILHVTIRLEEGVFRKATWYSVQRI